MHFRSSLPLTSIGKFDLGKRALTEATSDGS
jgi:hypothetical protein